MRVRGGQTLPRLVAANRAAAVAMADGPEAGLAILAELGSDPAVARWPQLHVATAELPHRAGDADAALAACRQALRLGVADAQRAFVERRIRRWKRSRGSAGAGGGARPAAEWRRLTSAWRTRGLPSVVA